MRTRVTISVPDDVYLLIKQQSALHGKSMSAWVDAHTCRTPCQEEGRKTCFGTRRRSQFIKGLTIVDPFAHTPEQILITL